MNNLYDRERPDWRFSDVLRSVVELGAMAVRELRHPPEKTPYPYERFYDYIVEAPAKTESELNEIREESPDDIRESDTAS